MMNIYITAATNLTGTLYAEHSYFDVSLAMLMSEKDIKKLSKIDLVREAKIVANVFLCIIGKNHT